MMSPLFFMSRGGPWILALAVIADFVIGDSERLPHPVRLIGRAVSFFELYFRRIGAPQLLQGALFALLITGVAWLAVYLVLDLLGQISRAAYWLASTVFVYYSISLRCLADEAAAVRTALGERGLDAGRARVSRIVGRDTAGLDETGVIMAAIESVAENMVDGVISPFFYAAVGGPAFSMCYKAVSTLDSMIGYKNSLYSMFGRWAARMDDVANYIPARLSVLLIAAASSVLGYASCKDVLRVVAVDGRMHESPNSGLPEAAFAASLGVRLSGPASYGGRYADRPFINSSGRAAGIGDIGRAVRLLYLGSILFFALWLFIGFFLCR